MTNTSLYISVTQRIGAEFRDSRKGRHQFAARFNRSGGRHSGTHRPGHRIGRRRQSSARWQALTDRLNRLRQEDHFDLPVLPDKPEPSGTIIEGRLRIGIWLMPDNSSIGELEDFVGSMIPCGDPVWPCPKPISMAFHPTIVSLRPAKSSGPRSTPGWRQRVSAPNGFVDQGWRSAHQRGEHHHIRRMAADTIPVTTTSE